MSHEIESNWSPNVLSGVKQAKISGVPRTTKESAQKAEQFVHDVMRNDEVRKAIEKLAAE